MKPIEQLGISPAPWRHNADQCAVWADDRYGSRQIVAAHTRGSADEANARLIAAAPELYEALREWVEELCDSCQAEVGRTCDGECEAVRKAKAALEKAGGME